MKSIKKCFIALLCAVVVAFVPAFAACTVNYTVDNVSSGDITAEEIIEALYQKYKEETGEDLSYADFLAQYLSFSDETSVLAISSCLLSSMKVYTEFIETSYSMGFGGPSETSDTAIYTGGAVIYSMDDSEGGYTYIITNYHVIYDSSANSSYNNGVKIARRIVGYLYGSEGAPVADGKDSDGFTQYDYGDYAIELEYIGGAVSKDLAVLRAETEDIKAVNEYAKAVTVASGYHVGETAYAIGNPEDEGISVTKGVVCVESENIILKIDGTSRTYRSIRIDTALYSGNSGGGLFNANGELIGIANAGDTSDENINYAIPVEIVTGTVDNIIFYANDGNDSTNGAYTTDMGLTVYSQNSKSYLDEYGYISIKEDVTVSDVSSGSICNSLGIVSGDIITGVVVNGTEYSITRTFNITDVALIFRPGYEISFNYVRDGSASSTSSYTLQLSDLSVLS